jgi:hypothetical protein
MSSRIPVYLPDNTQIGTATVNVEAGTATIKIQSDSSLSRLIQESLVGLSVVYMDRDAVEAVQNEEKN